MIGVYSLPVDTMVWLGNVIMGCFVVLAMLVGGGLAAGPMEKLVAADVAARTADAAAQARPTSTGAAAQARPTSTCATGINTATGTGQAA